MKTKELRSLNEAELKDKMNELRNDLIKENAQIAIGTVPKSPGKIRLIKKTIAKIKTMLREKEEGGNQKK